MKKINSFNKENIPAVSADIKAELAKIATKYGLQSISLGSISYEATQFRVQLTAKVDPADSPEAQSKNKSYSEMLGYADNIVGLKFTNGGKEFEVVELMLNRPKFPIVAKNTADGKQYKFPAQRKLNFSTAVNYDAAKNIFAMAHQ